MTNPDLPEGLDPETGFAIDRALRAAGLAAIGGSGVTAYVADPPDPTAAEAGDAAGPLDFDGGASDGD